MSTKDDGVKISTYWGEPRMRNLWESLYDQEAVSKCRESDLDLQSMAILQANAYSLFKKLKHRYDKVVRTNNLLTERMDASNGEQIQLESEVTKLKARCQKLEQELSNKNKKLKQSEKQMKSIASILRSGGLFHRDETQVASKAYTLLSEMFDENENPNENGNAEIEKKSTSESRGKHLKQNDEHHSEIDSLQKDVTLVQELFDVDENSMEEDVICLEPKSRKSSKSSSTNHCVDLTDNSFFPKDDVVELSDGPELLEDLKSSSTDVDKNKLKVLASTVSEKDQNSFTPKKVSVNPVFEEPSESLYVTPKKRKSEEMEEDSLSPLIGSMSKKSFPENKELKPNVPKDFITENKKNIVSDTTTSPSLLKDSCASNEILNNADEPKGKSTSKRECQDCINSVSTKEPVCINSVSNKEPARWELKPDYKPQSPTKRHNRFFVSKNYKQTKLSVAKVPKVQDLSSFGEFAGGVLKTSTVDPFSLPGKSFEDKSHKSVDDKSDTDQDDEVIIESPNAGPSRSSRYNLSGMRFSVSKDKNLSMVNKKDAQNGDETIFIARSASKNNPEPRNQMDKDTNSELLSEMEKSPQKKSKTSSSRHQKTEADIVVIKERKLNPSDIDRKPLDTDEKQAETVFHVRRHRQVLAENSFDRIPEKVSDSPDYVYKPDRMHRRNKRQEQHKIHEVLQKLCDGCRSTYDGLPLNTLDAANLIKQCERHRRTNSPIGIWDMDMTLHKK